MDELLTRALEGIDPADPNATWLVFLRLMGMVDWWMMVWLTVLFTAVGGLIGWWRGHFWRDLGLGAALGPIGWIISLFWRERPAPRRCLSCGHHPAASDTFCARCGVALPPPMAVAR
ncbi:MAG: hypothetical protein ABI411_12170 [Tahibacter sp.]